MTNYTEVQDMGVNVSYKPVETPPIEQIDLISDYSLSIAVTIKKRRANDIYQFAVDGKRDITAATLREFGEACIKFADQA